MCIVFAYFSFFSFFCTFFNSFLSTPHHHQLPSSPMYYIAILPCIISNRLYSLSHCQNAYFFFTFKLFFFLPSSNFQTTIYYKQGPIHTPAYNGRKKINILLVCWLFHMTSISVFHLSPLHSCTLFMWKLLLSIGINREIYIYSFIWRYSVFIMLKNVAVNLNNCRIIIYIDTRKCDTFCPSVV